MSNWIIVFVVSVFSGVLLLPNAAGAVVVIEVAPQSSAELGAIRQSVETSLHALGEELVDPAEARERWQLNVLPAPDLTGDAEYLAQAQRNVIGRSLFFESEFERAIELLAPGLAALREDPSVLAFRPDLAAASFEAVLTLVRAYDALGRASEAQAALESAAQLMWFADATELLFPPGFIADFENMKSLLATRPVTVREAETGGCEVWVNGFRATVKAGEGTLRVPVGQHFIRLKCAERESRVHRVPADRSELDLSLDFDDAANLNARGLELRPRRRTTAALRDMAEHGGRALGASTAYLISEAAPAQDERAQIIEIIRVRQGGPVPFRAVRVRTESDTLDLRIAAAVSYLLNGRAAPNLRVWDEQRGWAEQVAPVGRRSVVPWALGGVALVSGGAAVWSEVRLGNSLGRVSACADRIATRECAGESLGTLRGEARRRRTLSNTMWSLAGVGAVGAIWSAIRHRPVKDLDLAILPTGDGGFARAHLRF